MFANIKRAWVRALRSGKYKQGFGCLKDGDEYCCLGVLREVVLKKQIRGDTKYLTERDLKVSGLTLIEGDTVKYRRRNRTLAQLNDASVPFSKIADIIEEQL